MMIENRYEDCKDSCLKLDFKSSDLFWPNIDKNLLKTKQKEKTM